MKESRFGIVGDGLTFKENFEGEGWTRRIGGVPTDVTYNNGVGELNGTTSNIVYSKNLSGVYTVRFRFNSITPVLNSLLVDFRNNDVSGTGYIISISSSLIIGSSGTVYVNGVVTGTIDSDSREIVVTGITIDSYETYFMSRVTSTAHTAGEIELFEIYEGTWTAEEVKNAYNNVTYREIPSETSTYDEKLRIDSARGSIADKYGNAIVNTAVLLKKDGGKHTQRFNGSSSLLNIDSVLPQLADTTIGTWMAWVKPFDAMPSSLSHIIGFGDTNANEYIQMIINTDGKFYVRVQDVGATQWDLRTNAIPFISNKWAQIAIVQDGTSPILYVDGVAVAQTFLVSTDKTSWFSDLTGLDNGRIGCLTYNSGGDQFLFKGDMNDERILEGALTKHEVMQTYTNSRKFYI